MARRWHAVPAQGLDRAADNPCRHDDKLWRAGGASRYAQSGAGGRPRQRLQSDQYCGALSSRDRSQRVADRIWRWARAQAMAAAARRRDAEACIKTRPDGGVIPGLPLVIARSEATKQSTLSLRIYGLLRGACHGARIRATRWLCAEHDRQLGGESPLSSLMVAKD